MLKHCTMHSSTTMTMTCCINHVQDQSFKDNGTTSYTKTDLCYIDQTATSMLEHNNTSQNLSSSTNMLATTTSIKQWIADLPQSQGEKIASMTLKDTTTSWGGGMLQAHKHVISTMHLHIQRHCTTLNQSIDKVISPQTSAQRSHWYQPYSLSSSNISLMQHQDTMPVVGLNS